jgi:hypothetical protein
VGDAPVAESEKMIRRGLCAGSMRGGNRRDTFGERDAGVGDDEWVAARTQCLQLLAGLLRQEDDRAVRRAVDQRLQERDLPVVLVEGRAENEAHLLLERGLHCACEDRGEVVGPDVRHGEADVAGTPYRERACTPIRREVVGPHVTEDLVAVPVRRPAGR